MKFIKMHGAGNDYVYIDCFREKTPKDPSELARRMSDRHFGVGADGLVLICPPTDSRHDGRMRMFNADGSEAQMCGNAIRCVAKHLYDHGVAPKTTLSIETGRGPLAIEVRVNDGKATGARVNMMVPILNSEAIPTTLPGNPPLEVPLAIGGRGFHVTCVSMGNPHAIVFVEQPTDEWVLGIGPRIETSPQFPQRTNVEFVQVLSRNEIRMRVWERGSGETLACGTGACAATVAAALTGRTGKKVRAHLPGGVLELEWSTTDDCVYMTGPATFVFEGNWPDETTS